MPESLVSCLCAFAIFAGLSVLWLALAFGIGAYERRRNLVTFMTLETAMITLAIKGQSCLDEVVDYVTLCRRCYMSKNQILSRLRRVENKIFNQEGENKQ